MQAFAWLQGAVRVMCLGHRPEVCACVARGRHVHALAAVSVGAMHACMQMCRLLAYHKVRPRNYTTCMFNETWLKGSGYE